MAHALRSMALADFGNTQCKLARVDEGRISAVASIPYDFVSRPADEKARTLAQISTTLMGISAIQAISVVSEKQHDFIFSLLKQIIKRPLNLFLVTHSMLNEPLKTQYPLDQLGTDRLMNVIAAKHDYPELPFIVLDVGTATTLDAYCPTEGYLGGLIVPGFYPFWETLHRTTAKLPAPEVKSVKTPIGTNTETAIQRGLGRGYVGLLYTLMADLQQQLSQTSDAPCKVLWTGGGAEAVLKLAKTYEQELPCDQMDSQLTLRGVYHVTSDSLTMVG